MNTLTLARAFAFCAGAIVAVPSPAQSGRLADAKLKLGHRLEDQVIAGAKTCVDENNLDSVELLLDVMRRQEQLSRNHLTAAHYRDVTFEYVTQITDVYAQRRVAEEARKNKKYAFARQWAAEALGFYGKADHGEALTKALGDKDNGVKRWAAWSLGKLKFAPAVDKLKRMVSHKDEYVRANVIEALARCDATYADGMAVAIRNDKDGGVRAALLGAANEVVPEAAETLSTEALKDDDWRVRIQGIDNLRTTRTKTAVDALITALHDNRAVNAKRALVSLQKLTGQPISQREVWPKWWADNRETFTFPDEEGKEAEKEKPNTVTFEGIPLDSDHVAFVLDKSIWMQKGLTSGRGMSRDAAALEELGKVVEALTDTEVLFNIYIYDDEIGRLSKKLGKLTKKSAKKAMKFASAAARGKSKDQWLVLEEVVERPEIDTVYFISSGEADTGLYVHGNRIGRHLEDLNRFYKKTIHSIAYSEKGFHWHVKRISDVTGGTFKGIE